MTESLKQSDELKIKTVIIEPPKLIFNDENTEKIVGISGYINFDKLKQQ